MKEILFHNHRHKIYECDYKRFHQKYIIDDNGCWIWQHSLKMDGYAQFWLCETNMRGHVASFLMFNEFEIPKDKPLICHRCDVIKCVNPEHLWAGTISDNQKDCRSKNRYPSQKGENNHCAVLTDSIVIEIRKLQKDNWSIGQICGIYDIKASTIKNVFYNQNYWPHIK